MENYPPMVIESSGRGERAMDIYSLLLKDRIIFLTGGINTSLSNSVIAQLLYLNSLDTTKDIQLYINSPGGTISDGLAIYDTMQFIKSPVNTMGIGMAASMGAILLMSGAKRTALPNTQIMLHQPWVEGVSGQATDIEIKAKEIIYSRSVLYTIIRKHTGRTKEQIAIDFDRDKFMSVDEAKEYNILDM